MVVTGGAGGPGVGGGAGRGRGRAGPRGRAGGRGAGAREAPARRRGAGPVRRLAVPAPPPQADDRPAGPSEAERQRALEALGEVAAELEYRATATRAADARDVLRAQVLMARDPGLAAEVAGRTGAGH